MFQTKEISEMDIRAIFRMIDVDKSGNISRTVEKGPAIVLIIIIIVGMIVILGIIVLLGIMIMR